MRTSDLKLRVPLHPFYDEPVTIRDHAGLAYTQDQRMVSSSERSKPMTAEWQIARTQAHLHLNGTYSGISVSLTKCRPSDETLKELNLPPLPKGR